MNTASLPQVASARTIIATVRAMLAALPDFDTAESVTFGEFVQRARLADPPQES